MSVTVDERLQSTIRIADAARIAGMTANGLRWHIARGHVRVVGTPLGNLVMRESLEEFLIRRETETAIASR